MSDRSLWTMILIAAAALLAVLAWRKGLLARVFPPPNLGQPMPFPGGISPTEYGPASPSGGMSKYGTVCNSVYQTSGTIAMSSGHPGAMAGGAVAKAGAPAICAAQEWAVKSTVGAVKAGASGVASGAKSAWKNTLGRIF